MKVKDFIKQWANVESERADCQKFWLALIRDVFNLDKPENFIKFELPVKHGRIDCYFPDSKVIVEQKSPDITLDNETFLQAKRYNDALEYSRKARWIITCNFKEFLIYDMDITDAEPIKVLLEELPEKFHVLDFLIDINKNKLRVELELSLQAGEIVAKIYDALLAQYINPNSAESLADLNKLCVRLVFCLYAESSGIFGKHKIFRDYLEGSRNIRRDLIDLFNTLNTPIDARDPYLDEILKKFPYVNGGLFEDAIEIPNFTPEIKNLLLDEASGGFNWSGISPTIFGAVFESTLNPTTRRAGGMHYTSIENIHKVIDPLFLDDLHAEFTKSHIQDSVNQSSKSPAIFNPTEKTASQRNTKSHIQDFVNRGSKRKIFLLNLQKKLSEIKILDPACGSGNFLTESFISLRRIENLILKELLGNQIQLGELDNPIKVSINQFYGIEINDFAVSVAQTALWIAELQMIQETQAIIHKNLDFLPLKSYSHITKGNALRLDWNKILIPNPSSPVPTYIIGNPPFRGKTYQDSQQKADLLALDKRLKPLDYVTGWYFKAARFMQGKKTSAAFLSTNSITQGEQVGALQRLLDCHIDFAHRTFKWMSESNDIAAVHCVVIGFSCAPSPKNKKKIIFDDGNASIAQNINGYLLDAPDICAEKRNEPLCPGCPAISKGFQATDNGFLILNAAERENLIKSEPAAEKWIRPYAMGLEFLNNIPRYCLWLVDATPHELRTMPKVMKRIKDCREWRSAQKSTGDAYKLKDTPHLFRPCRQFKDAPYIAVPLVSSERRKYIPMAYVNNGMIPGCNLFAIFDATLYHFGVLTSSIHMSWMRVVCGRLKSDYRYSATLVYNNFVWCTPTSEQKSLIEQTAQKILDVRAKYSDSTLADLYDEDTMPKDLRDAHKKNDLAVAKAYGFEKILGNERAIVAELFKQYALWTK